MAPKKRGKVTANFTDGTAMAEPSKKKPPRAEKRKKASSTYKMPPPLPSGTVLRSVCDKTSWVSGQSIGKGGFGEIYLATLSGKSASVKDARHVVKMEPQENGPLFTEQHFYKRVGRRELIDCWVSTHKLCYLGIPKLVAFGFHECGGTSCRFLVLERFGDDVDKLFHQAGGKFGIKTVCHLALRLLEALEYLHSKEYVHADIKGSNLLTGFANADRHKVYLVDYGLADRYFANDEHRKYSEDRKRCHDGTVEFTSTDAHNGVRPSRRGDMEILGYCLLHWASGSLPWERFVEKKDEVAKDKKRYKTDPRALMKKCFSSSKAPTCLMKYMENVSKLDYDEKPNYILLQELFISELEEQGLKDDGKGLDWLASTSLPSKRKRPATEDLATNGLISPPKKSKPSPASKSRSPSKRPKSSPRGRRKNVATGTSTSPKRLPLKEIVVVSGDDEMGDTSPIKKSTTRKRTSPKGKQARKRKPYPSAQRRQVARGGEPDHNSAELGIIPRVIYPPELGYPHSECIDNGDGPSNGSTTVTKSQPKKKGRTKCQDTIVTD